MENTADDPTSPGLLALVEEYELAELGFEPFSATRKAAREYDAEVPDRSTPALEARADWLEAFAGRVAEVSDEGLEPSERLTRRELIDRSRAEATWLRGSFARYMDGRVLSPQSWLQMVPSWQPLRTPEEAEAYATRVSRMGAHVRRCRDSAREGLARGVVAPGPRLAANLEELERTLARPLEEWGLCTHAADHDPALGERVLDTVRGDLAAALGELRDCLRDELAPAAPPGGRAGMGHLPDGAREYSRAVRYFTSLEADSEELHQRGLECLRQLRQELEKRGKALLGTDSLEGIRGALAGRPELFFETSEEILETARADVARALEATPAVTSLRPQAELEVQPFPEGSGARAQVGFYVPPSPDGAVPGIYYVNTTEPTTRPRVDAEMIAFHESVPGHHLQIAVAQTLDGLPDFRRLGGVLAYCEGWATYAEGLAEDLGLYSHPRARLGCLVGRMWRAARLVLDTGLHAKGWSFQDLLDFAWEEVPFPRARIEDECFRHLWLPGQALAYQVGADVIRDLRTAWMGRPGAAPSLPGFHDRLLGQGPLHLETLRWWMGEATGPEPEGAQKSPQPG
jgi:uncharacterized protein (DUF885 family)